MELNTVLFDEPVSLVFAAADAIDAQSDLTGSPSDAVETVKAMCRGQLDGRGIPMEEGCFTPMGVAGVLESLGLPVTGLDGEPDSGEESL
ncbi:hypothetical protein [Aeromonas sp. Y318-3]|uniref:hypothetical protein n=1 Tax=Aeromonas sp. Y318-3 TaxID=2990509 RepID=UPI0022E429F1|nr:hypothetical protein [Aeromonas sp. Y318-3]